MPLHVTRFAQFPYYFKLITLFFTLTTLIALSGAPPLGGSSLIWFTVIIALIMDLLLIVILIFDLDRVELPIRGLNYNSMESACSLALSIFYFISIWLCFNGEEFTENGWFYLAALACFVNFVVYAADFVIYLRMWMADQRAARADAATYEYPSYGSP
ncbi:MARVEL domain-containing protein [Trichostrongylus colubriformis]|uniref:MARVEL domain-containing protein n=1 Tax=Trichostrongylus colubriformis TaxID=6319 RepID=A0AAN8FHE7_TRICO